jgi:gluconolactonase
VKVASEVRWPKTTQALPPVDVDWCSVPDDLEIVAEGLDFPEGPIACADGTLLVVEVRGGRLMRVFPTGGLEIVADLGGGPNGAALGPDGAIYICNNGGLPWSQLDDGSWYPVDLRTG